MVTSSGFFFFFFLINKLTDVSTHLHSTCGHFCCGSSRCVTKKKEPTAETRRKEEKIVECRQVLMLSDTDVQTFFFFQKKNYRGVQWKGSYLWTRKWADASDRMAGQKKNKIFKKIFFDLLGRLLTFWVISSFLWVFFRKIKSTIVGSVWNIFYANDHVARETSGFVTSAMTTLWGTSDDAHAWTTHQPETIESSLAFCLPRREEIHGKRASLTRRLMKRILLVCFVSRLWLYPCGLISSSDVERVGQRACRLRGKIVGRFLWRNRPPTKWTRGRTLSRSGTCCFCRLLRRKLCADDCRSQWNGHVMPPPSRLKVGKSATIFPTAAASPIRPHPHTHQMGRH